MVFMFTAPLNKVLVLWKINVWGWWCLVPGWFHHACWRGTRGSSTRAPWWNCTRRPLCQLLPPLILKNTKLMLSRAGNQNTICKIMSARPEKLQQEGRIRNWCQNLLKKANTEFISFSTDNPCSNVILRKGWADVFEGEWRQSLVGGGRIVLRLPLDDSPEATSASGVLSCQTLPVVTPESSPILSIRDTVSESALGLTHPSLSDSV